MGNIVEKSFQTLTLNFICTNPPVQSLCAVGEKCNLSIYFVFLTRGVDAFCCLVLLFHWLLKKYLGKGWKRGLWIKSKLPKYKTRSLTISLHTPTRIHTGCPYKNKPQFLLNISGYKHARKLDFNTIRSLFWCKEKNNVFAKLNFNFNWVESLDGFSLYYPHHPPNHPSLQSTWFVKV